MEHQAKVALLLVELHLPTSQSLKEKRRILRPIIDKLKNYNLSVAEVGDQNKWQRSVIAVSMVANDSIFLVKKMEKITSYFHNQKGLTIINVFMDII